MADDLGLRCVVPAGDICGEGAVWSADERRLYWVDINRFLIHALREDDGSVLTWQFAEPAVALALTDRRGVLLVALGGRLILWTPADDGRVAFGAPLADWPDVRFNDGRADAAGRFWIGTMGNNVGPDGEAMPMPEGRGQLMRYGADASVAVLERGIGVSNTVCWSPDGATFYFGDTTKDEIRAYDFDAATGAISGARPFLAGFGRGWPDGSAVDRDGYLWNCRYGGGCIVRVAPDARVDRVVELPVRNATTCTFGGPDLRTLYVTTARIAEGPTERLAGSLFALRSPVAGLPERPFRPA
jgi:sugar lactone lactonase YvrE